MAESTTSDHSESSFQRTVSLYNWWLVKAQNDFRGKRLAVAGISSRKDEALRVFVSAPVVKRYDVFSLETADGIYVIINGFINEQRTLENGFSPEVFNQFLFGFPPDWESYALDCFREESSGNVDLGSAVPGDGSASCPKVLSDEAAPGEHEKPVSENGNECNVSEVDLGEHENPLATNENGCNVPKETSGVNVACGSGGNRCSARLRKHKEQLDSGGHPKHSDKDQNTISVALENCVVEGPKSPATPIQSQPRSQVNTSSEMLVKNSASRISRNLSAKTEGHCKEKRGTPRKKLIESPSRTLSAKTEGHYKKQRARHRKKLIESASTVKSPQVKDVRHLSKGSKQKTSSVSAESLSLRISRSGRLLLPPLEFWRNQIPVYNADHEVTEIQDGASLVTPCRGSSASLSRG